MGTFRYNNSDPEIEIGDATLEHLRTVITAKLRRRESFILTFSNDEKPTSRTTSVRIHPSIPLRFTFETRGTPRRDGEFITQMMNEINSRGELTIRGEWNPEARTQPRATPDATKASAVNPNEMS